MSKRAAIVGAGISGLVAAKECLEEGIIPTVFESRDGIGGQWRYEEPDAVTGEAFSSVYEGTMTNSNIHCSHFSDFPIDPAQYPDYLRHEDFLRYIEAYARHFGLHKYLRLNTKVIACEQVEDGKWRVATRAGDHIYDALFVCAGKNSFPHELPQLPDMEYFKGSVIHSHVYRRPSPYIGRRVAVVGFGSSAVDIASEICLHAKSCHLVTRRGGWVFPRYVDGEVTESHENRLAGYALPRSLLMWRYELLYRRMMGDIPTDIKPDHRILEGHPIFRTEFLEYVRTGRVKPHRASIERFTENGIRLDNDELLEVDDVIFCTGYRITFPFIAENTYRGREPNSLRLYRLITHPEYRNLFFIGLFDFASIVPVSELQARWAVSVLSGRLSLPSTEEMEKRIHLFEKKQARLFIKSDQNLTAIPMLEYMETLARDLGVIPTLGRLLWNMFSPSPLTGWCILMFYYRGIITSAPYRLFGHGQKPELAKATMLRMARRGQELSEEEKTLLAAERNLYGYTL